MQSAISSSGVLGPLSLASPQEQGVLYCALCCNGSKLMVTVSTSEYMTRLLGKERGFKHQSECLVEYVF